jgi:hypothetical protein
MSYQKVLNSCSFVCAPSCAGKTHFLKSNPALMLVDFDDLESYFMDVKIVEEYEGFALPDYRDLCAVLAREVAPQSTIMLSSTTLAAYMVERLECYCAFVVPTPFAYAERVMRRREECTISAPFADALFADCETAILRELMVAYEWACLTSLRYPRRVVITGGFRSAIKYLRRMGAFASYDPISDSREG